MKTASSLTRSPFSGWSVLSLPPWWVTHPPTIMKTEIKEDYKAWRAAVAEVVSAFQNGCTRVHHSHLTKYFFLRLSP